MDIVRRLDVLADECRLECGGFTGDGLIFCKAAEEIRKLRSALDGQHAIGYRDGYEAAKAHLQAENERLRAALTEISMMRAEDMYRGDDDNAAAFIARAALAPQQGGGG